MSQQGERPADGDDWWDRLYDETDRDTGAGGADGASGPGGAGDTGDTGDTLEDRFDSVARVVGAGNGGSAGTLLPEPEPEPEPEPSRTTLRTRAPWEPPEENAPGPGSAPAGPPNPRTFADFTAPRPMGSPTGRVAPMPTGPPKRAAPSLPAGPVAVPGRSTPVGPPVVPAAPTPAGPPVAPDSSTPAGPVAVAGPSTPAALPLSEGPSATPAPAVPRPARTHVGDRPPTYDAEPTALPVTVPQELDGLVAADTVLDGARYGTYTLRAASVRGESARYRGEHRRDALLTARFGTDREALVLVAVATGARASEQAHLAAADACRWIGGAIGRSHLRLTEDIRAGRRGELKSGLHRLTDRGCGRLRARAAELGLEPGQYSAGLRCLLLPADPDCRTRIFFGTGAGGFFRLRGGVWQDLEPGIPHRAGPSVGNAPDGGNAENTGSTGSTGSGAIGGGGGKAGESGSANGESPRPGSAVAGGDRPAEPFRFRTSVARSGDMLLLCSPGLAVPLREEPALAGELAERWTGGEAPGLAAFLTDTQLRVKGYSDDRTSAAVWEA
ncbi:protein phosphatase 2C domain-containing protein [Streptomyces sp. NPDC006971]|uniref:protein phosphatase 2C domain-containing protein n=1 Tax=Streptomyces sp. NPDC006971 TaxID=3154784 RepID=UPI0033D7B16B